MPKLSKKQQAELEQQAHDSRIRAALHWTEAAPGPDVQPPKRWGTLATGYMFNAYTLRVDVACTSSGLHSVGRTDKTTSQRPLPLYSTRLRALLALRNAVERECAGRLEKIDRMIKEAQEDERTATVPEIGTESGLGGL